MESGTKGWKLCFGGLTFPRIHLDRNSYGQENYFCASYNYQFKSLIHKISTTSHMLYFLLEYKLFNPFNNILHSFLGKLLVQMHTGTRI